MLKWHENRSIGKFRGENEIHELFFPFDPPFPLNGDGDFFAEYRQMTPQSTRNRMRIIFLILTGNNNEEKLRN